MVQHDARLAHQRQLDILTMEVLAVRVLVLTTLSPGNPPEMLLCTCSAAWQAAARTNASQETTASATLFVLVLESVPFELVAGQLAEKGVILVLTFGRDLPQLGGPHLRSWFGGCASPRLLAAKHRCQAHGALFHGAGRQGARLARLHLGSSSKKTGGRLPQRRCNQVSHVFPNDFTQG